MSVASPTAATPPNPATVGLWLEFDAAGPPPLVGEARIRHARGLVTGLDAIPAVATILLPCLPSEAEAMAKLFADAARPGRLLSDKLQVVAVGRDPAVRRALMAWAERRRDGCRDRLAGLGATGSPRSWRAAVRRLADESPRRPFAASRRVFKLAKLTLRLQVARAVMAAAGWLPSPQATVVAELRRRGFEATWIVLPAGTECARRLPGPKILDLGGGIPPAGAGRAVVGRLARMAAVVVPSRDAADRVAGELAGRSRAVVPPAPLPARVEPVGPEESRRLLGDELRGIFLGDAATPLHRHFCDFPFERVEYLVAWMTGGNPGPLLAAYATVLRRHRRDLKLLVDGRLPRGDGRLDHVESLGLSFDVARCAGLTEAGRGRLLRHARLVVVPEVGAGGLPAIFCEAVAAGTPVVMSRLAAVREMLTMDELSQPEYVDAPAAADGLAEAMLYVLDRREAVLARQRLVLARLAHRRWDDVVRDTLHARP